MIVLECIAAAMVLAMLLIILGMEVYIIWFFGELVYNKYKSWRKR